jgi:hypothetical protein
MAVDLNEPTLVKPYEMYEGRNTKRMPELLADGRTPASVADIMERRLNSQNPNWKSLYFDTGDLIAYHPNGNVKVVRDAQLLRELTPKTQVVNGALMLPDGMYESLDGVEFKRTDAVFDKDLKLQDARIHQFWQYVARDDALLASYADAMFPEMKAQFGFDEAMGIYLAGKPEQPQARALFVGRLDSRSRLGGRDDLGGGSGRLVGVAPEARSAPNQMVRQPTLEQAVALINRNMGKLGLRVSQ